MCYSQEFKESPKVRSAMVCGSYAEMTARSRWHCWFYLSSARAILTLQAALCRQVRLHVSMDAETNVVVRGPDVPCLVRQ
jgi:hypothetical protein